jgi:hypothetical protein
MQRVPGPCGDSGPRVRRPIRAHWTARRFGLMVRAAWSGPHRFARRGAGTPARPAIRAPWSARAGAGHGLFNVPRPSRCETSSREVQPAHAVDGHFRHGPCLVPRLKLHQRLVTARRPRGKDRAEPACGRTWPPLTRKPLGGPGGDAHALGCSRTEAKLETRMCPGIRCPERSSVGPGASSSYLPVAEVRNHGRIPNVRRAWRLPWLMHLLRPGCPRRVK